MIEIFMNSYNNELVERRYK